MVTDAKSPPLTQCFPFTVDVFHRFSSSCHKHTEIHKYVCQFDLVSISLPVCGREDLIDSMCSCAYIKCFSLRRGERKAIHDARCEAESHHRLCKWSRFKFFWGGIHFFKAIKKKL